MYLPRWKHIYAHVNVQETNTVEEVTINHKDNLLCSADMSIFLFVQLQYLIDGVKKKIARWCMDTPSLKLIWQLINVLCDCKDQYGAPTMTP